MAKFCGIKFKICSDEHSLRVRNFMLDVMTPLIIEGDSISNKLLDIILMNIIEPNKTQKKNAYILAHDLIKNSMDTLEPYISNVSQSQTATIFLLNLFRIIFIFSRISANC